MSKVFMAKEDICTSFRDAKNKKEQIGILADLNACKVCEIEKILVENGFEVPMRGAEKRALPVRRNGTKIVWDEDMKRRLEGYVREGLSNIEIADILGVSAGNVSYRVSFYGFSDIRREMALKMQGKKIAADEGKGDMREEKEDGSQASLHLISQQADSFPSRGSRDDTPIDTVYIQHLQAELEARVLECEALKNERDAAIRSAEVLTDENRQLVETFTVDMGKATNENLALRKELDAVREELSRKGDALLKKNIRGLAHLVLCGLKKLSEGHSPYDVDILDGAMVGVANMILELDAE